MDKNKLTGPLAACRYLLKKYPFKYKFIEIIEGATDNPIRYLLLEDLYLTKSSIIKRNVIFDSKEMK